MQLHELAGTICSKHHKLIKVIGRLAFCAELPISERCTNETLLRQGGDANERGAEHESTPARPDKASPAALNGGSGHARDSKAPAGKTEAASGDEAMLRDDKLGDGTKQPIYTNGNGHGQATNGNGREPGADEEEDLFQQRLLRWKAHVFQVAEKFLIDPEFRPYQGDELIREIASALGRLVFEVKGIYTPPEELTEGMVRDELETIARLLVPKPKPQPQGKPAPPPLIEVLELNQLYHIIDEWDRQPWIWDGILPHASLSLIVGKSETGKSTLIYSLIYAIVKGEEFLGRMCTKGRVLYLAGDPISEIVAGKLFRELGISEGITVMRGALAADRMGMKLLRQVVESRRPSLVVADTLAATVNLDTDKYGQSYQAQQPLSALAREFKPNFLMSHHSQKSAIDNYSVIDAALGSVGVAAVASTRMATKMYRRKGEKFYTFEMSNLRIGRPLEGEMIIQKMNTGLVDKAGMWRTKNVEMDKTAIVAALQKKGALSKRTLWSELRPKPKWEPFNDALDELFTERTIREVERAGKGGGKLISLAQSGEASEN